MAQSDRRRPMSSADPNTHQRRRHRVLPRTAGIVLAIAVAAGLLAPAPVTASTSPTTATVNIQNLVTGLCVDLPDTGPAKPDAPVTQYDCRYTQDNQRWHLERHGSSEGRPAYLIKNDRGGCLDLPYYGKPDPGTPVSLYDCRPQNDNQLFVALPTKLSGVVKFAHALDQNLCLDVAGFATGGNDARLTLWTCSDTDDHHWLLRRSASDDSGASLGVVATEGAALTLRAEPRADSPRRGALANHTPFQIQCVAGSPGDQWYRTTSGRYTSANYVQLRGPTVPSCGGVPAEDLKKVFEHADEYSEADAAWATLGDSRQHERTWQDAYGATLKRIAQKKALEAGHITDEQVSKWKPDDGLHVKDERTDATAQDVYNYYGWLFGQRPELLWAGMAKLAGGPVYAGMQDAAYVQGVPGGEDISRALLTMQKAIFDDLAWQHQLYVDRGLPALERVNDAGLLLDAGAHNAHLVDNGPTTMISAWRDIASGDKGRINRGNRVLIAREQDPILQEHYEKLMVTNSVWVFGTSRFGRSPIPPGTNQFWDTQSNGFRNTVNNGIPMHLKRSYRAPNLTFSIAFWEDRQKWVYEHLLPDYLDRLEVDYQGLRYQIVDRPVADRANDYRNLSQKKLLGYGRFGPPVGLIF